MFNNRGWLVILFLTLVAMPLSTQAANPPQVFVGDSKLEILYPKDDYFPYSTQVYVRFKPFNSSGFPLDNTTTRCQFFLEDTNGIMLMSVSDINYTTECDCYSVTINDSLVTEEMVTSYAVMCNNSREGGFVSSNLYFNKQGNRNDNTSPASVAVVLFLIFISGILFLVPIIKPDLVGVEGVKGKENQYARQIANLILKRGAWLIAIYMTVLNLAIIGEMATDSGLHVWDELVRYIWIGGTIGYIFMGFLVFSTLITVMKLWRKNLNYKRTGEDPEW